MRASRRAFLTATVLRIGFLRPGPPPKTFVEALHEGLREHGYVAGDNVVIDYRVAGGGSEQLSRLAEELVRLNVDVILASGGPAAVPARNATRTLPIVFAGVYDLVETGLAARGSGAPTTSKLRYSVDGRGDGARRVYSV